MLAVAMALLAAGSAQGATSYPSGGSDFAANEQGWVGSPDVPCSPILAAVCTTSTEHEATQGNPPGSITVRMASTVNLGGILAGTGTWTSPSFTVPAGDAVTGATFEYDRQLVAASLVGLTPTSTVTVELLDVTAGGTSTELLEETLTAANSSFARLGVGAPAGAVTAGRTYQLRIQAATSTTTGSFGVVGQENTRFDNVVLAVDQGGSGGSGGGGNTQQGGATPIVSPGVTVVKGFRSDSQIQAIFSRYDEGTLVGRGPGGSLIPLAQCTIVGTARADRITGTSGNDVICGLGGNDRINGAGGIDIVDGANGNDRVSGGRSKDKLIGLRGKDRLNGNAGNDRVGGGRGRDVLRGAAGKDRLKARDRTRDVVDGGTGRDRATVDRLARGARRTARALRRTDRVRRVERRS
jgi:Ca2+-binding RTX toxin-like protein